MRSLAGKVVWVGRTAATVFGLALVLALVFGVATTAIGATGGTFILGKANGATTVSKLTASIAGPALTLVNQSTNAAATALNISVASGKPPLKVNAEAGTATNLSADELDGKDATDFMTYNSTLKSGQTLVGVWGAATPGTTTNAEYASATIDFRPKLAADIPRANTHYVTSTTSECPGEGQAAAGHLCVYVEHNHNLPFFSSYQPGGTSSLANEGLGTVLIFQSNDTTANARGTWAVTAP